MAKIKQAVDELAEKAATAGMEILASKGKGWPTAGPARYYMTEGYRRALRDVLRDIEEAKIFEAPYYVCNYDELTAKIKARLEPPKVSGISVTCGGCGEAVGRGNEQCSCGQTSFIEGEAG